LGDTLGHRPPLLICRPFGLPHNEKRKARAPLSAFSLSDFRPLSRFPAFLFLFRSHVQTEKRFPVFAFSISRFPIFQSPLSPIHNLGFPGRLLNWPVGQTLTAFERFVQWSSPRYLIHSNLQQGYTPRVVDSVGKVGTLRCKVRAAYSAAQRMWRCALGFRSVG
jgi:hypothetical protein